MEIVTAIIGAIVEAAVTVVIEAAIRFIRQRRASRRRRPTIRQA